MSLFRPITISFALDRPSIKNVESSKPIKVQSWVLWRLTSILIHVIALTLYTYTLCYSLINYHRFVSTHPDRASAEFQRREVFGKWKFLTHWNHVIQLVYFAVAVAFDLYTLALPVEVIESKSCPNKSPPISIFHALYTFFSSSINAFFHAIVVPCALLVCILFWALFAIDGGLVVYAHSVPEPGWLMHTQHSLVALIVLIELCLTPRSLPSTSSTVQLALLLVGSYLAQLFAIGILHHHWAYGILARLSSIERAAFIVGVLSMYSILAILSRRLYSIVWPVQRFERFYFGAQVPKKWLPNQSCNDFNVKL